MNMRKIRMLALLLSLALALGGCENTKIVLTTGLASDELFRIGEVSCMLPEALVYLCNQKNQYETTYGIGMWEYEIGDETLEEYLKSQVVSQLAQVKSMVYLAGQQEVELSEENAALAASAGAEYYTSLDAEEIEVLGVDQELIAGMYEDYCLARQAYEQITEDAAVEISDDEARIIEIQQIYVVEETLANELKIRLDEGEDFESLASNYSKSSKITLTIARGDMDEEYEEVAFSLDNGEVSEVFASGDSYYILKCTSTYLEEESEENKEKVAQQQRTTRFQEIYSELMADTISEFQDALWEKVVFEDYDSVTTDSFFEVYEAWFGD
ncbi:MAG: peptidylprolyl isomerase [Lachnospiraceae bacterium]|nr:peptidylprolyl isomerase [Lachnospiraceae bacterium]